MADAGEPDIPTSPDAGSTPDADASGSNQDASGTADATSDTADELALDASPEEASAATCDAAPKNPAPCTSNPAGLEVGLAKEYPGLGLHAFLAEETSQSVLIGRDCGGLYALRAVCPHMGCTLAIQELISEEGVICGCHGSAFDLLGQVTKGPAKKSLPALLLVLDCDGKLYVDADQVVDKSVRLVVEETG